MNGPETSPMLLLTTRRAAELLSISEKTLYNYTKPRGDIPVIRIGRTVRYDPDDLRQWIQRVKEEN